MCAIPVYNLYSIKPGEAVLEAGDEEEEEGVVEDAGEFLLPVFFVFFDGVF